MKKPAEAPATEVKTEVKMDSDATRSEEHVAEPLVLKLPVVHVVQPSIPWGLSVQFVVNSSNVQKPLNLLEIMAKLGSQLLFVFFIMLVISKLAKSELEGQGQVAQSANTPLNLIPAVL